MAGDHFAATNAGLTFSNETEFRAWRKEKRAELLRMRGVLTPEAHERKSGQVMERLLSAFRHFGSATVSFYWPFRGEISALPFMEYVLSAGGSAALPVVLGKGLALEFRLWKPGDPMASGVYDIPYPATGECVEPDVLIAALVGFDSACYRLGYGGGYYDRTLAAAGKKPLSIGIGFESARLETIYPQPYDVPMDWIVTEDAIVERSS
jgi:5-formyltetrahydrofolate cyclo-ligase